MSLKEALASLQGEIDLTSSPSPSPTNSELDPDSSSFLPLLDYSHEDADAAGIVVVENVNTSPYFNDTGKAGVDTGVDAGVVAGVTTEVAMASSAPSSEFADVVFDSSFNSGTEPETTTQSPIRPATAPNTNTNTNTNIIVKTEAAAASRKKTIGPPPQVRIPILRGTLCETREWDDQCEEMKRKHILKGTWRFNDDRHAPADPDPNANATDDDHDHDHEKQPFELIRTVTGKEDDTPDGSAYFTPSNGMYHGTFRLSYVHTTPKGKRSTKVTTLEEKNVKLEFRKLQMTASSSGSGYQDDGTPNFYYRIQGSGSNAIGRFSLGGTAKPDTRKADNYIIELRKTYFGMDTTATTMTNQQTTTTGSVSSSLLLLQSQQQTFSPTRIKNESRSPSSSSTTHTTAFAPATPTIPRQTKKPATKISQQKSPKPTPQPQPAAAAAAVVAATATITMTPSPPLPPQHFQPPNYITNTGVDRVNGKGMWHAWTRSFDTPLLALLDLFDNAVDASWTLLPTASASSASASSVSEHFRSKPKIRVDLDHIGRQGVVIRNASHCIPSLKQVLEVYKSSKTSEADTSIGENGIGVKHACASLSTLSFVFTKSKHGHETYLSMGILMQELQLEVGIVLPSRDWHLPNNNNSSNSMEEMKHELETVCQQEPLVWGKAIRDYGDAESESKSNNENAAADASLSEGIDHCLRHFEILLKHRDWKEYENVFAVVLTNLKHAAYDGGGEGEKNTNEVILIDAATEPAKTRRGSTSSAAASKDGTTAEPGDDGGGGTSTKKESTYLVMENRDGEGDMDEDQERSLSLLDDLRNKLPYLYLHLHELDIVVDSKPMESIYWERRLAELSKFELHISQTQLWSKVSKEFYTAPFVDDVRSVYHVAHPTDTIRFFCGFDPYRCQSQYDNTRSEYDNDNKNNRKDNDDEDQGGSNLITSYVPGGNSSGVSVGGNNSALKVFLYSRQSGRLIKAENDPRNDLGLTAGSTDFCQGLTIIIDDHNGTLPLNPTKQDTAYGHSKYGQIHAANLKEWTAAIGHFYWNYHYMRLGNSKVAVTQAVSKSKQALEEAYTHFSKQKKKQQKEGHHIMNGDSDESLFPTTTTTSTPLYRGSFITFGHVDFALTRVRDVQKIRAHKTARDKAVPTIAVHEVVRLNEDAAALVVSNSARKKRKSKASSGYDVHQHNFNSDNNNNNNNDSGSLMVFSQQQQQQQQRQQHGLILEKHIALESAASKKHRASPVTVKRLRSSQDENGDLDQFFQSEQQWQSRQGSSTSTNNSNLLNTRVQQYEDHNCQLQQQVMSQVRDIKLLQDECRKLTIEKQVDAGTIEKERAEREQWMEYGKSKRAESASLRKGAEEMRRRLDHCQQQLQQATGEGVKKQAVASSSREGVVDLTDGNTAEIAKLRQVVKQLKSSVVFYKKGNEAKTVQIENLMQEKSRFEDRVRELEGAQLDGMSLEF